METATDSFYNVYSKAKINFFIKCLQRNAMALGAGDHGRTKDGKSYFSLSSPPQPITLNLHSEKRLVEKTILEKLRVNKFIFNNHLLVPSLHLV